MPPPSSLAQTRLHGPARLQWLVHGQLPLNGCTLIRVRSRVPRVAGNLAQLPTRDKRTIDKNMRGLSHATARHFVLSTALLVIPGSEAYGIKTTGVELEPANDGEVRSLKVSSQIKEQRREQFVRKMADCGVNTENSLEALVDLDEKQTDPETFKEAILVRGLPSRPRRPASLGRPPPL